MTTPQAAFAAFMIAALISTAIYFTVTYRRTTKRIADNANTQGEAAIAVGTDQPRKPGLAAKLNYLLFTDKHPHFDARDSHNHTAPHNGSTNPTSTAANH
ncbi:hypothetical protein [Arthrobacter humicola]|jgi:hypothetical protein|uniref:hypothetical protein n=1 Tax=Arthrobacter humicola TaxID=409291 RepID=UPI001FAE5592|nr:hypothetical protein [Arthrobacter humicola]MCI9869468.1 hypothetical protein [Arthrobacter humicola]